MHTPLYTGGCCSRMLGNSQFAHYQPIETNQNSEQRANQNSARQVIPVVIAKIIRTEREYENLTNLPVAIPVIMSPAETQRLLSYQQSNSNDDRPIHIIMNSYQMIEILVTPTYNPVNNRTNGYPESIPGHPFVR